MKKVELNLGRLQILVAVPESTDVLSMTKVEPIRNPRAAIEKALDNPIASLPLKELVRRKLRSTPQAEAAVVCSDNTRPVPYRGESGILMPILTHMMDAGLAPARIRLLIATGTHRKMSRQELEENLDPAVFSHGFEIVQHDCRDSNQLVALEKTKGGNPILINRIYMESEIRILTGLVESHFMAGVSGGRKSICPGLLGENSVQVLHGGLLLSSPSAKDMVLTGNPVHEEATRVARMAGCDMIVNVTLDSDYRLTGVFAGDLELALVRAYEKIKTYATFPVFKPYDIVLSHAGYVGVNHYQAAKGAVLCVPIIEENGICLLAAHHTDRDPIGGANYKTMMRLLGEVGAESFVRQILDPSWAFVPEQWEAQMWAKLFLKTAPENCIYCSLEIPKEAFSWLPERDAKTIVPQASELEELVQKSLDWAVEKKTEQLKHPPKIAVLKDGPYGIPLFASPGKLQPQKH
jgi:nickel-dependent lactate racemase